MVSRDGLVAALVAHRAALADRIRVLAGSCVGPVESWWFDSDGFGSELTLPGGPTVVVDDLFVSGDEFTGAAQERQACAAARNELVGELSDAVFEESQVSGLLGSLRIVASSVESRRSKRPADW